MTQSLLSFLRTRESRVSTITLPCRLRFLMQTNLFNYPVMQTVVFTLIPWILDQVEDDIVSIVIPASARESSVAGNDTMVIARKPSGLTLFCHSRLRAGIQS